MFKKLLRFLPILLVVMLLFSTNFVFASDTTNDIMPISEDSENLEDMISESIANAQNNVKDGDAFLADDDVVIDYIVDGNVFVIADTVTINSQITGDVFVLANKLIVNEEAYISNNIFSISSEIEIKGLVHDIYAISQDFTISGGYIYRDLNLFANTLDINGVVGRNVFVTCDNINFNSDGNDDGIIYGDLNYFSNSEAFIPENAVSGSVNFEKLAENSMTTGEIISVYILDLGMFLVLVIIIWLICRLFTSKSTDTDFKNVGKNILKSLGVGILTLVIVPIICVFLLLFQLTSGISLLLIVLYILALVVSKTLFTITANNYLCSKLKIDKNTGILGMLIVTGILIWGICQIPYIGGPISFILCVLGLGILTLSIISKINKKQTKNGIEVTEIKTEK